MNTDIKQQADIKDVCAAVCFYGTYLQCFTLIKAAFCQDETAACYRVLHYYLFKM